MSADAIITLHERIQKLESELEELRHVTLCALLQLTPTTGTGNCVRAVLTDSGNLVPLGDLLTSQEHEIPRLVQMLMQAEMRSAGESPGFTREDLLAALEIVRNRRQNRPKIEPHGAD